MVHDKKFETLFIINDKKIETLFIIIIDSIVMINKCHTIIMTIHTKRIINIKV